MCVCVCVREESECGVCGEGGRESVRERERWVGVCVESESVCEELSEERVCASCVCVWVCVCVCGVVCVCGGGERGCGVCVRECVCVVCSERGCLWVCVCVCVCV